MSQFTNLDKCNKITSLMQDVIIVVSSRNVIIDKQHCILTEKL